MCVCMCFTLWRCVCGWGEGWDEGTSPPVLSSWLCSRPSAPCPTQGATMSRVSLLSTFYWPSCTSPRKWFPIPSAHTGSLFCLPSFKPLLHTEPGASVPSSSCDSVSMCSVCVCGVNVEYMRNVPSAVLETCIVHPFPYRLTVSVYGNVCGVCESSHFGGSIWVVKCVCMCVTFKACKQTIYGVFDYEYVNRNMSMVVQAVICVVRSLIRTWSWDSVKVWLYVKQMTVHNSVQHTKLLWQPPTEYRSDIFHCSVVYFNFISSVTGLYSNRLQFSRWLTGSNSDKRLALGSNVVAQLHYTRL